MNGRTGILFLRIEFIYFFPGDKLFVTLKSNSLLDAFLERIPTSNIPTDHYYHRELTKSVSLFIYMYMYGIFLRRFSIFIIHEVVSQNISGK